MALRHRSTGAAYVETTSRGNAKILPAPLRSVDFVIAHGGGGGGYTAWLPRQRCRIARLLSAIRHDSLAPDALALTAQLQRVIGAESIQERVPFATPCIVAASRSARAATTPDEKARKRAHDTATFSQREVASPPRDTVLARVVGRSLSREARPLRHGSPVS